MTGALATFKEPYYSKVLAALKNNQVSFIPEKFKKNLTEDGYLVEDEVDELEKINNLVARRRGWKDEYFLSILLNLDCNFKCFYCFESHTGKYLSNFTSQKIISMIYQISKSAKKISVDWYGGEPLLSFNKMRFLNDEFIKICNANNIEYATSITTNGYLLSSSVIKYLESAPLTHLQITLDGPPETHNISRPLKNDGPTFDVILGNIKEAVAQEIEVIIRVNITKLNVDQIPELYQIIDKHGLKNKIQLMLKPVVSSSANPCENCCLSEYALGSRMTAIYKWAAENGWIVFPNVDSMQCMGFCIADFPSQFIIDLQGNLYKCGELFTSKEAVGRIGDKGELILDQFKYKQFVDKNPLNFPECKGCNILPICMGGCNMKRFWKGINCCEELKHDLPQFLEVLVLNQHNMD